MDDGVRQAQEAELALLRPEVRMDPRRTAQLLHPDFVEFGSSGRVWTRGEILRAMAAELSLDGTDVVVSDLRGTRLAADVVHLTCTTSLAGSTARRSSVWRRTGTGWQLWFHQGTPVTPTAGGAPAGE